MRAGAREFSCPHPIALGTLSDALSRAWARRPASKAGKAGPGGKVVVFLGGKGGSGVTTVACNFAVSLVQECNQNTVLIDLDLPLGDAALNLGITPQFSTVDALQNYSRLDQNFLSKLLTKHSSGLFVLAAPGKFPQVEVNNEAVERLVSMAKQAYDFVVIDAGLTVRHERHHAGGAGRYGLSCDAGRDSGAAQCASRDFGVFQERRFKSGDCVEPFYATLWRRGRRTYFEGADAPRAVEDSQRLCDRAPHAERGHAIGA